ncbi:MAG TPA: hypothetical protein VLC29_01325 [Rhizomicrobium sp.]|jgi:hypothetical protein|nr:hypothetical protein [Rhizomicrobium sp.]
MQIASAGSMQPMMQMAKTSEATEGPGPDHDGDADDGGVTSPTLSATAPGVGNAVDITA